MQKIEPTLSLLPVDGIGEGECIRRDSVIKRSLSAEESSSSCSCGLPSLHAKRDTSYKHASSSSPSSVISDRLLEHFAQEYNLHHHHHQRYHRDDNDQPHQEDVAVIKEHPASLINRIATALQMEDLLQCLQRDNVRLSLGIAGWYSFGFVAIITTKLLLTTWQVPPLLLTVQQLMISSTVLGILLQSSSSSSSSRAAAATGMQPWPADRHVQVDFVLIGFFNALDFLASNCGFEGADASFVETIKASEPITTTIVALSWKIDTLGLHEAGALALLFTGVLLSTLGNTTAAAESGDGEIEPAALEASIRSTLTVMTANLCFAFRVLCQKRYRSSATATDQLTNTNLLYRMQTTGWMFLLVPAVYHHFSFASGGLAAPMDHQMGYLGLSLLNSTAYVIYNLSSCYVLTQVSALQSMGINCLRRMLATLVTCFVFGVTLSTVSMIGICMCFGGFALFTLYRNRRQTSIATTMRQPSPLPTIKSKICEV